MPKYRVEIPVFTRLVEVHFVTADSEADAVEECEARDPEENLEDTDYYEILMGSAYVTKISTPIEDIAETAKDNEEEEE
jgi:hypothetical protein